MTLNEVMMLTQATCVCGNVSTRAVNYGFGSDLMSDVLTLNVTDLLLITGMCNPQTIRTAEMGDIKNILFVRGKKVTPEMKEIAADSDIVLMETSFSMFHAAGVLYSAGLPPVF